VPYCPHGPLGAAPHACALRHRLESMLGLEACTSLEELYLSHNGIWRIEGTNTLSNLRVLDVSNNRISKVEVRATCAAALSWSR
jgi:Leucine-rich repeat (LRR) protein